MTFPDWNQTLLAVSASFHGMAILSTLFRLWYRWCTERMWWDDAWAVLAFLADIAWLVAATLEQPISGSGIPRFFAVGNWIVSFAYPTLMWAARISILTSIVRVSRPEGTLRYITFGIGALFGILGVAMLGLRIHLCVADACLMTKTVLVTQSATDCIADILLSALPIWFLRSVKLSRERRILVLSAFSASMVIDLVTIAEVVICFQSMTSGSIVFEHVKVACSMIVCNLLVITAFVYRILHRGKAERKTIEFTTVDLAQPGFSQAFMSSTKMTKSSTWSFRHGDQSKEPGSVSVEVAPVSMVSRGEDEARACGRQVDSK